MSNFVSDLQFGRYVYQAHGLSKALKFASDASTVYGLASSGIYTGVAASALAPVVGTGLAVASTLYGAKTIYDGVRRFF